MKMIEQLRETLRHTTIYSIGNIANRLIGVILLPLYTTYLSVADYGILGILEVTLLLGAQFLILGQNNSLIRFYHLPEYHDRRSDLFFTILSSVIIFNSAIFIIAFCLSDHIASIFNQRELFSEYIKLAAAIILLRTVTNTILSHLRAVERPVFYSVSNLIKIGITVLLNVLYLAYLNYGIDGVLLSYLWAEIVMILVLIPALMFITRPKLNVHYLQESLRFGLPLTWGAAASILLHMGDRYLLKLLTTYHEVGLYSLGYKIGSLLNILFIQSFSLGVLPIAYKLYRTPGDKQYYSKIMTYFVLVLIWAGLAIALLNFQIIKVFARDPQYWPAASIVPVILLAYIFNGGSFVAALGLYLEKKTKILALNNIAALIFNFLLNLLLIPYYKMVGAAYATLLTFILLSALNYFTSNHFYEIRYEGLRLIKALLIGMLLFYISGFLPDLTLFSDLAVRSIILLSYPFILYLVQFYEPEELLNLKYTTRKLFGRSE